MVARLLRLRIALLAGALRGRPRAVARTLVALALLLVATAAACLVALGSSDATDAQAAALFVLGGAVLVLGCALVPILAGMTDPLEPRRFAILGLSSRTLPFALAVAGLASAPVLALAALSACTAIAWARRGTPIALAVASAVAGFVVCVLVARVSLAVGALYLRERRSRELSGVLVAALAVILVPVVAFLASVRGSDELARALDALVGVVAVTPLGAPWALAALTGPELWAAAAVAVATAALLGLAWVLLARRQMTTIERPVSIRSRGGLGWFALLPGTPTGAIAARGMRSWLRDRRYVLNVVIVPVGALLSTVPLLIAGMPREDVALLPALVIALFLGWLPHNDVAYDSTAIWMHVGAGVRGVADRVGRLVPILVIGVVMLAVAIPVAVAFSGRWEILPALVGAVAALFLSGLGLSSISSVLAPYPVARPGDSPFQQPQRTGSAGVVAQVLVLAGALACAAPALWWMWLALAGQTAYALAALVGGVGIGLVVLALGALAGGRLFDRRGARLMEFAETT